MAQGFHIVSQDHCCDIGFHRQINLRPHMAATIVHGACHHIPIDNAIGLNNLASILAFCGIHVLHSHNAQHNTILYSWVFQRDNIEPAIFLNDLLQRVTVAARLVP